MKKLVVIRGGGDIASGVAHRLFECGFGVIILEIPNPTVIRRTVSFAAAVFKGHTQVEGITARLTGSMDEVKRAIVSKEIPVVIDPDGEYIDKIKPFALVDCILAKRNIGTRLNMAAIVIGVGPGFTAGKDVDAVVESNRGHDLGRVLYDGKAMADTGVPGNIGGYTSERLVRACADGTVKNIMDIGDLLDKGDVICEVDGQAVCAEISGCLRGLIHSGSLVHKGMKIGDIDPRGEVGSCFTISDKARSIAGGVLEAILHKNLENTTANIKLQLGESRC